LNNKKSSTFVAFCRLLAVYLGRLLTLAAVLGSTGYALYYAHTSAYGTQRFPVARIEFTGVKHLDQQALTALLRHSLPGNLLQVDLAAVRRTVESESWIQSASVRRVIPDRLVIQVIEREPAAVAIVEGALYVVDERGTVLDRYGAAYDTLERPIVKGLARDAREENANRMQTYLQVIAELEESPKGHLAFISEVDVADPQRVALIPTEEPVPVLVGDKLFLQRYETFVSCLEMYRQLKERYGAIDYVDMTLDDRVVFHRAGEEQAEMFPAEEAPPAG
jgi:cell division protein FtsQ